MVGGKAPNDVGLGTFQWTYNDPNWDWRNFDLDRDTLAADRAENEPINATNPDLSKFKAHGGKLIMYHGWADPLIAPENAINYYNSVQAKMGGKQEDWYRLFMVPGMSHCRGGEGPNQFNAVAALERWKEQGVAPAQIVASHLTEGISIRLVRCARIRWLRCGAGRGRPTTRRILVARCSSLKKEHPGLTPAWACPRRAVFPG